MKRLTNARVLQLAEQHGWSLRRSDEFGGGSEAHWRASYHERDPATWRPLVVDDGVTVQREAIPPEFRLRVIAVGVAYAGTAAQAAPRAQARPRGRREQRKRSQAGSRGPRDDPDKHRPASGRSPRRPGS
jgi:hypothetical protein